MKVLFINLPYYGHVVPTIGLVQELIQQGASVTYLMPFDWEKIVKESGASFYGYKNHKKLSEQMKNAYNAAEEIINQYDLVVYEQFFFLGKHLADKYNKLSVRIFTAPATNKKLMNEFVSTGPLSIFRYKWIAKAFTKDIAGNIKLKTDNWLDEIIFNPPSLNLVYTLREYQPYIEEFSKDIYKFLGPSIYNRKLKEFYFLKTSKPVIYISLGTVIQRNISFYEKCIGAFKYENVDVIISLGNKVDLNKFKSIPANIHIYSYVPQTEVLKITDVFITHGGMNSVSESLVYGVPMVIIPFSSDQPTNARCVEKLGVGKKLEYKSLDIKVLKNTVLQIMQDNGIKENIIKVQEYIHKAPGNKGGANMIIDYYRKNK